MIFIQQIPAIWVAFLILPFGACVGSFLNVVAYRLPLGISLNAPSRCPHCQVPIRPLDNVPFFGWLLLRGKARCCGKPFSFRYPLVEVITALLWAAQAYAVAVHGFESSVEILSLLGMLSMVSFLLVICLMVVDGQTAPRGLVFTGVLFALALAARQESYFWESWVAPFFHSEIPLAEQCNALLGAATGAMSAGLLAALIGAGEKRKLFNAPITPSQGRWTLVSSMILVGAYLGAPLALTVLGSGVFLWGLLQFLPISGKLSRIPLTLVIALSAVISPPLFF